jgi:thiamine-monophosphate kinase
MGKRDRPGEFALIARYFRPLAKDPGAFQLADDAALLRPPQGKDLVITTDVVAEGVHFFRDDPPESIAKKALRVNLSDLAGKGASPLGYLMTLALREDWTERWVAGFAKGLAADQERYRIPLLGGDTSRASCGTTITITAIGTLPRGAMVHRSGARPGDPVFVTGTIGDAALGLRLRLGTLNASARAARFLRDRYLHPDPRVTLAPAIRRYATSALDVSDGLVGDFAHICDVSGVGGEIEAGLVPFSPAARAVIDLEPAALVTALTGGDDYEILATVRPKAASAFRNAAARAGVAVTRIGRVTEGAGTPMVLDWTGEALSIGKASFDHFGRV